MRSLASQFRTGVRAGATVVLVAASALMLACAGVSSGPSQSSQPPPTQPPPTNPPPSTHSVSLSWDPSASSDISGYNVYRAQYTTSCGSFGRINSLLNTGTLYTDSTVADGTSYCYATTAVNTSNAESGYSNVVSNVQIPAN